MQTGWPALHPVPDYPLAITWYTAATVSFSGAPPFAFAEHGVVVEPFRFLPFLRFQWILRPRPQQVLKDGDFILLTADASLYFQV